MSDRLVAEAATYKTHKKMPLIRACDLSNQKAAGLRLRAWQPVLPIEYVSSDNKKIIVLPIEYVSSDNKEL